MRQLLHNQKFIIITASVFTVIFKIAWIAFLHPVIFENDQLLYDIVGKNIAEGRGFTGSDNLPTASIPPVYPYFAAAFFKAGFSRFAIYYVQALLTGIITALTITAACIISAETGAITAVLIILCPDLFIYSQKFLTEILYLTLSLSAVFLFGTFIKTGMQKYIIFSGILFGAAVHTRPAGLLIPFFLAIFYFLHFRDKHSLKKLSVFLAFYLLCFIPWGFRNYSQFNRFILITTVGGKSFYGENNPLSQGKYYEFEKFNYEKEAETSSDFYKKGIVFMITHPRDTIKNSIIKLACFFHPLTAQVYLSFFFLAIFPFILPGFIILTKKEIRIPLLAIFTVMIVMTVLFRGSARYRVSYLPYLIVCAAHGIEILRLRYPQFFKPMFSFWALASLILQYTAEPIKQFIKELL